MPTLLAPRTRPDLPASLDVLIEVTVDPCLGGSIQAASHSTNPVTPDWRLSGEQDERTEE
jgi:hypothetical protein